MEGSITREQLGLFLTPRHNPICSIEDCGGEVVKLVSLRYHTRGSTGDGFIYLCEDHDVSYGLKPATIIKVVPDGTLTGDVSS